MAIQTTCWVRLSKSCKGTRNTRSLGLSEDKPEITGRRTIALVLQTAKMPLVMIPKNRVWAQMEELWSRFYPEDLLHLFKQERHNTRTRRNNRWRLDFYSHYQSYSSAHILLIYSIVIDYSAACHLHSVLATSKHVLHTPAEVVTQKQILNRIQTAIYRRR